MQLWTAIAGVVALGVLSLSEMPILKGGGQI